MKCLLIIMSLFLTAGAWANSSLINANPAYCEGETMYSLQGTVVYKFRYSTECDDALDEARVNKGRFCTFGTLVREDGKDIYSFTFSNGCWDALKKLTYSWTGLFCGDNNKIYQIGSALEITDMHFDLECKTALNEANLYKGLFCNQGQMFTREGIKLKDYSFETACRRALIDVSRGF
ncbi:MAG TPA: hypothetical protein VNJ08_04160 [Bacteriovoracaceae bacterium]|nr:hypothetical protein [Bacteriovoracaceae bacterium]